MDLGVKSVGSPFRPNLADLFATVSTGAPKIHTAPVPGRQVSRKRGASAGNSWRMSYNAGPRSGTVANSAYSDPGLERMTAPIRI